MNIAENTTGNTTEFALRVGQLTKGDILLSTTIAPKSWAIRIGTISRFSHAALYIGGGYFIEAVGDGVRRIHARALRTNSRVEVFRPYGLNDSELDNVVLNAQSLLYRPYSTRGSLTTRVKLMRMRDDPGLFFSQLVAEAFADEGVELVKDRKPEEITPKNLSKSKILKSVTDQAVEELPTLNITRAIEALAPQLTFNQCPTIQLKEAEAELLDVAIKEMSKHACFQNKSPYHFFNALQMISEEVNNNDVV